VGGEDARSECAYIRVVACIVLGEHCPQPGIVALIWSSPWLTTA
jgi:hypothetical protein